MKLNFCFSWAQAILFPGCLNICFSLFAWVKYENPRESPIQALKTLPFVFLQFYPQVRALKVIANGCCFKELNVSRYKWITDLEEYEANAAHLEGVVKSTSTIFIQTAIVGSILAYKTKRVLDLSKSNCEEQCANLSDSLDSDFCEDMSKCVSACISEFLSLDYSNFQTEISNAPNKIGSCTQTLQDTKF